MPVGFPDYYGGLTLPVTVLEGGTGQTSFTAHAVIIGQGTSGLTASNVGTPGQVLQIPAGGGDPVFADLGSVSLAAPVTISPYQQDALLIGASSDLPAARGALEIAAPSGSTVNPLIVSIATTQLLNLSPAGNLIIAGALTLGSPLAIAQGGTGTATPALTAGTNIAITGSWPNNTIALDVTVDLLLASQTQNPQYITRPNVAGFKKLAFAVTGGGPLDEFNVTAASIVFSTPLPIASGGTGTTTPALVAGTAISITGSWPDQTINNTSAYATLADPLAVAHGGTGTTSPALVAGANIAITGTWPDNTIALAAAVSTTSLMATAGAGSAALGMIGDIDTAKWITAAGSFDWNFLSDNSDTSDLGHTGPITFGGRTYRNKVSLLPTGVIDCFGLAINGVTPSLVAGSGISISGSWPNQTVAIAGGGTVPTIVATVDLTAQTGNLGPTTLYTPSGAGLYRITIEAIVKSTTGTSTLSANILHTQNGQSFNNSVLVTLSASGGYATKGVLFAVYADASTAIQYTTTWSSGGAGDSYDIHVRVEAI